MSGEKMSEHCSSLFDIQICQIVDPGEGRQHNDSSQVVTPVNIPLTPCIALVNIVPQLCLQNQSKKDQSVAGSEV